MLLSIWLTDVASDSGQYRADHAIIRAPRRNAYRSEGEHPGERLETVDQARRAPQSQEPPALKISMGQHQIARQRRRRHVLGERDGQAALAREPGQDVDEARANPFIEA